jgi:hypothetical protein
MILNGEKFKASLISHDQLAGAWMWGSPGKWDAGKRAPSQLPSLTKTSRLRPEWSKSLNSRREIEIKAGLVASSALRWWNTDM